MTRSTVLVLLLATACVDQTEPIETDTPTGASDCIATLTGITPEDGAVDVPANQAIELRFSAPAREVTAAIEGADSSLNIAPNGLTAALIPNEPLDYERTYDLTVEVCGVVSTSSFTTAPPPVTVEAFNTYAMPFDELVWNEPQSSAAFTPFVEFENFLFEITNVPDDAAFEAAMTAGWPDGDPECPSVVTLFADFTTTPLFSTDAAVLAIPVEGPDGTFEILVDNLEFGGRFTADQQLLDVTFTGRIDTRPFDLLLGGEGATCELADLAGDTCIPCADGVESCLFLDVSVPETIRMNASGIVEPCGL